MRFFFSRENSLSIPSSLIPKPTRHQNDYIVRFSVHSSTVF